LPTWADKKTANEERYVRAREKFLMARFDDLDHVYLASGINITPVPRGSNRSRLIRTSLMPLEGGFEHFDFTFNKKVSFYVCGQAYLIWFMVVNFTWKFLSVAALLIFFAEMIM
jgi:hypothetical protein